MHLRDWTILLACSAVLPWLAVQIISFMGAYGPLFWGLLHPGVSEITKQAVIYSQWLFDALVFSAPVGISLACLINGKPLPLSALVVLGYTATFFIWGFSYTKGFLEILSGFVAPNHLLLVCLLGVNVFLSRLAFQNKEQEDA